MKKIMLCCSAGMSTSLLVKKMLVEAEKRGLAAEIKAQIKYMQPELQAKAAVHGVKVQPIDMMDYGMQRGDKVLDYALSLIG